MLLLGTFSPGIIRHRRQWSNLKTLAQYYRSVECSIIRQNNTNTDGFFFIFCVRCYCFFILILIKLIYESQSTNSSRKTRNNDYLLGEAGAMSQTVAQR